MYIFTLKGDNGHEKRWIWEYMHLLYIIPVVVHRLLRQQLEYREVYQGAAHIDQSENPSSVIRCFSSSLEIYPWYYHSQMSHSQYVGISISVHNTHYLIIFYIKKDESMSHTFQDVECMCITSLSWWLYTTCSGFED